MIHSNYSRLLHIIRRLRPQRPPGCPAPRTCVTILHHWIENGRLRVSRETHIGLAIGLAFIAIFAILLDDKETLRSLAKQLPKVPLLFPWINGRDDSHELDGT